MKSLRVLSIAGTLACLITEPSAAESFNARITIQADRAGAVINPNIYGQFVEHLGRGVYEGIWVGPDSADDVTLSVVNLDPARAAKIQIGVQGSGFRTASGRVITAESMDARPDFGKTDPLKPEVLRNLVVRRDAVSLVAPAKSVIVLQLRLLPQPGGGTKKSAE